MNTTSGPIGRRVDGATVQCEGPIVSALVQSKSDVGPPDRTIAAPAWTLAHRTFAPSHRRLSIYSLLNAITGSTLAARQAGAATAMAAVTMSTTGTATKVIGSSGFTA